ncbi:MAG: acylneuraminate cytidylyltransferase family protein [Planctomycetes bacterium]|nr:acylneuraminate cytidylyltransferase family protein [Planctomycetota bacterium]
MLRICTICARGGSKGVKNKNIRDLLGKPLIAYSIEQAKASLLFDLVAVSSDAPAILDVARAHGADLVIARPDEMATDTAAKLPAIQHAVRSAEEASGLRFDVMVDLDATSPLRLPADIVGVVDMLERGGAANIITGAPAHRSPYFNLVEVDEGGVARLSKKLAKPIVRRQDAPPCYDMNASIYAWRRSAILDSTSIFLESTGLFVMPPERSTDIDSDLDFKIVELLMRERRQ